MYHNQEMEKFSSMAYTYKQGRKGFKKCMDKDMLQALNTYIRVMKNFVWVTDPSVVTVPFCTSRSKPFKAFICHDTKQKKSNNTNIKK